MIWWNRREASTALNVSNVLNDNLGPWNLEPGTSERSMLSEPPKGLSPRWQRPRSHEFLENFDDLGLPRNLSHRLFVRFG